MAEILLFKSNSIRRIAFAILVLIAAMQSLSSNAQQTTFTKVYCDSTFYGVQANDVVQTPDNDFLFVGKMENYAGGLIYKSDELGNILWSKAIGGTTNTTNFTRIVSTYDSAYVAAGSFEGNINPSKGVLLIKFTANGDTIWSKLIRHAGYVLEVYDLQQTIDSGFIIAGAGGGTAWGTFVAKLDLNGNLIWQKVFAQGTYDSGAHSVKQTADSGFILTGMVGSSSPMYSWACITKLSATGTIQWSKKYNINSITFTNGYDLVENNNGYLCLMVSILNFSLVQIDFAGNELWSKTYPGFSDSPCLNCAFPTMTKTFDNGYVFMNGGPSGWVSGALAKVDSDANFVWLKNLFFSSSQIIETKDSGFLALGNGPLFGVKNSPPNSPQIGIMKLDANGNTNDCVLSNSMALIVDTILTANVSFTSYSGGYDSAVYLVENPIILLSDSGCVKFLGGINDHASNSFLKISPNPSDGNFTISTDDFLHHALIEIFDLQGRCLFTQTTSNKKEIDINTHILKPGIYAVKVTDGLKYYFQKLIVQ